MWTLSPALKFKMKQNCLGPALGHRVLSINPIRLTMAITTVLLMGGDSGFETDGCSDQ